MNTKSEKSASAKKYLAVLEAGQECVRRSRNEPEIARIGKEIRFETAALDRFDVKGCRSVHYDLLALCAAIEFADRRWKRPGSWARHIHLTMPVIDLRTWQKPEVQDSLRSVLRLVTCDEWNISFVQANNSSPIGERQGEFVFSMNKDLVIAYSDGLDSRAVAALCGELKVLGIRVAKHRQRPRDGDCDFMQLPFEVRGHGSKESSFRSRGFQFAAVTAIVAQLSNISRIVVPESGQGALGPVLLPLHNIDADYRNHPAFFRKMERFVRNALGYQVGYEQPRLWFTKGQTMRTFRDLPGKNDDHLAQARSCWQNRPIVNSGGKKKHCGLCAACLLRRLSLHAARVYENSNAYLVSDLGAAELCDALSSVHRNADRNIMMDYGRTGTRHLQHLAVLADVPDDRLLADAREIATATGTNINDALKNLRTLLQTHAKEWRAFLLTQGEQSFLMNWLDGGRHGRPD